MTVIYADTLFIVNFSMDFLSLFLTAKSLHTKIIPSRIIISAIIGSCFATMAVIWDHDLMIVRLFDFFAFIACTVGMCAIAFKAKILRSTIVFMAVNLGLGGLISALCNLFRVWNIEMEAEALDSPILLLFFGLLSGVISLIYGKFRSVKHREVIAELIMGNSTKRLKLLVDSGNLLCEPISKKPVVILDPDAAGIEQINDISMLSSSGTSYKIRAIPTKSLLGEEIIYGLIPDNFTIEGKSVDVVIAPFHGDFNGFDGIISDILI